VSFCRCSVSFGLFCLSVMCERIGNQECFALSKVYGRKESLCAKVEDFYTTWMISFQPNIQYAHINSFILYITEEEDAVAEEEGE